MAVRALNIFPATTWLAGALLVVIFLTGGGSRADVTSLIVLRPVAAIAAVLFLAKLDGSHWRALRVPVAIAAAVILITALQLVPLPPALWSALPGRTILAEAMKAAALPEGWHPFSVAPWRTTNALMFWLVPVAAAAAVAAGDTVHRHRLLPVLIGIGLVSGLLSILQIIGPSGGPLHFYRYTSPGEAVGLFANRNHNALLLSTLFPLLAAFACSGIRSVEQHRRHMWIAIAAAAGLVPLILVVGSRAGVILLALGILASFFVYRRPSIAHPPKRRVRTYSPAKIGLALGFIGLGLVSFLLSRATSLDRLAETGIKTETRLQIWGRSWSLIEKYFPTGAGFGTFVETYQLDEPREILRLTYANHAHNDWLEILLGGGVCGALLLLAGVLAWAIGVWMLWQRRADAGRGQILGRAGAAILLMGGVASAFDYPARTPSIAALLAIAAVWMAFAVTGTNRGNAAPND